MRASNSRWSDQLGGIKDVLKDHRESDVYIGIDLGTEPDTTAMAAFAGRSSGGAELVGIWPKVWHGNLVEILNNQDIAVAAIDVPLGWPVAFQSMVSEHREGPLSHNSSPRPGLPPAAYWRKTAMALRATDQCVEKCIGKRPMSVSFDKLGAVTATWALIEAQLEPKPSRVGLECSNAGLRRVIETYPAGQMTVWRVDLQMPNEEFVDVVARAAKRENLEIDAAEHCNAFPYLDSKPTHPRDAIVCAMVAALAGRSGGGVNPMTCDHESEQSKAEGVIWLQAPAPDPSGKCCLPAAPDSAGS